MQVKFHTKIKHTLLDHYLKLCLDAQKNRKKPFYFVDLYAGDGDCECRKDCPNWNKTDFCSCNDMKCTWDGSPLIALSWAHKSKYPVRCFFNEIDPTRKKDLEKLTVKDKQYIIDILEGDANSKDICQTTLDKIPANEHSLFFLDPQKHSQLKWTTVKSIAEHTYADWYNEPFIRRPELLINFMTYTMQIDLKDEKYITEFIGNDKWKEAIKDRNENEEIHKILLGIYLEQLKEIYEQEPFFIEVRQTGSGIQKGKGALVYYLIFITSHPGATNIFKKYRPYIEKYKVEKFGREYYSLKGYGSIDDYNL